MSEPDLCQWEAYGFTCLALRDMKMGIWRGFVSVPKDHKASNKSLLEIIGEEWGLNLDVHGGLSVAGKLPPKYKDFNKFQEKCIEFTNSNQYNFTIMASPEEIVLEPIVYITGFTTE